MSNNCLDTSIIESDKTNNIKQIKEGVRKCLENISKSVINI